MFQVCKTQRSLLDAPNIRQPPQGHLQGGMTGAQQQLLSLWNPLTTRVDGQHELRHLKKKPPVGHGKLGVGGSHPNWNFERKFGILIHFFWFSLMSINVHYQRTGPWTNIMSVQKAKGDMSWFFWNWIHVTNNGTINSSFPQLRSQPPVVAGFHQSFHACLPQPYH